MEHPTTGHQSVPALGWAVAGPIRPRRFPNLRKGRALFIAAECLLNAVLVTYLIGALVDTPQSVREVALALVIWSGLAFNIALLIVAVTVRRLRRRYGGGLAA
jgi:hypothetical protein